MPHKAQNPPNIMKRYPLIASKSIGVRRAIKIVISQFARVPRLTAFSVMISDM